MKQVIVINSGLELSKGKWMAQAGHAAVQGAWKVFEKKPEVFEKWRSEGQKKVVLQTDEEGLSKIKEKAGRVGAPFVEVRDAGLTEVEPGTLTCVCLGPGEGEALNKIVGSLPLFK